jgi:hypothetical protein
VMAEVAQFTPTFSPHDKKMRHAATAARRR